MPNYCYNNLTLSHIDPNMISRAVEAYKQYKFLAEFIPIPDKDDWYDFCISNWGTKWDVGGEDSFDINYESNPNEVCFYFESAWSPPLGIYRKLTELGYDVMGYYYEPGAAFCGSYINGSEENYQIEGDSIWAEENIPSDILEEFSIIEDLESSEEEF